MTDPTTETALDLLSDVDAYLCALHGSVARHDNLAANLACAGCELRDRIAAALPELAVEEPPVDRAALRDRIAEALYRREWPHKQIWQQALAMDREVFEAMADAVLAVLPPPAERADAVTAAPVKQGPTAGEAGWAEQERARFERLYTRESARADLAEHRAETAARDADIYQKRLERLSEGYTEQRKRAEEAEARIAELERDLAASERIRENADFHLGREMGRRQLAEKETARLSADRGAVLREAADVVSADTVHIRYGSAQDYADRHAALLRRVADEAQPTTKPEAPPTAEEIARDHVLALHQIGEQLAGIESWMWEHLADVRDTAAGARQDGEV